jgi:putative ABC transport system permease protein
MGTLVVYQQIQFARNRPIGYDRQSLITVRMNDPSYKDKVEILRNELHQTGVVSQTATSSGPLTGITNNTSGHSWPGKDPALDAEFAICNVIPDFGKTVNWQIIALLLIHSMPSSSTRLRLNIWD